MLPNMTEGDQSDGGIDQVTSFQFGFSSERDGANAT